MTFLAQMIRRDPVTQETPRSGLVEAEMTDLAPLPRRPLIRTGSQAALIPLWFLSVYLLVVLAAPALHRLWNSTGHGSILLLAGGAVLIDIAARMVPLAGYLNFFFVWATMHQIGYAWHADRLGNAGARAAAGGLGLMGLVLLVTAGPYPLSMVGVPGAVATNNSPPTSALIALGVAQIGFLLSIEAPVRRLLDNPRVWRATILVNATIMTLYLWHLTAMVLLVGGSLLVGGPDLGLAPATASWWFTRPIWFALLAAITLPLVLGAGRVERRSSHRVAGAASPTTTSLATVLAILGFALIAKNGIVRPDQMAQPLAVLPVLLSAGLLRGRYGNQPRRRCPVW